MENKVIIDKTKQYLKGNLHIHTTASDGKYTLDQVTEKYKESGFDFLAITDHDVVYHGEEMVNGVLLLPGVEFAGTYCGNDNAKVGSYSHYNIIGNGLEKVAELKRFEYNTPEEINRLVKKVNIPNVVVQYNHPNFSRFFDQEYLALTDFDLFEIYNHKDYMMETSVESADAIMRKYLFYDKEVFVSVGDDYHGSKDFERDKQLRGSFVMVNSTLNVDAIVDALKNGDFYASTGPLVHDLRIIDNVIYLETSKVKRIFFYNFARRSKHFFDEKGITRCQYEIKGSEKYIWIKIEDFEGNVAWIQPIYLEES